jgi:mitochondrial import receptor subunit TOM70
LEAAQAFTDAIDLIEASAAGSDLAGSSLLRQWVTLVNNRSAMYEKANLPELALEDCVSILDKDVDHAKARQRKLRLLEEPLHRWYDALVEVCAVQLLFMRTHRNAMRMGLPIPNPPVSQATMENLVGKLLPDEVQKHVAQLKAKKVRPLPCDYTILQLLRSYTNFNQWMGQAAKDGSVEMLSSLLDGDAPADSQGKAKRSTALLKRGRRYVYDKRYALASADFEEAYTLVEADEEAQGAMEADSYARLLEWTGMVRHWHYNLDSAYDCYQRCSDLEPTNANILVKQAGVQMDAGRHDEAMKLLDTALGIDPTTVDALLHRSNLRMLQSKPEEAKADLEACLRLRPNHVMARLRLASILAAMNDADGASRELDMAEREDPNSSEVQSYRGELYFTQGKMDEAREKFELAIKLEPNNPTPYVNAALAVLNTPPSAPGQVPDTDAVISYFEKAIDVDPQFTAAYLQLGQLALGIATDIAAGREVITLYDRALENCRTPEEVKEICGLRILTVAQLDAATMLKMDTFSMQ